MHKKIIKSIFDDFHSFFLNKKYAKFKFVFGKKDDLKVYRTRSKSYLNIPENIKYLEINSDEKKVYLLFLMGHEIAHLVNKHLNYIDKNSFDTRSIEMWADFFGAKISMSILLHGKNFNSLLDADMSDVNKGMELIAIMLKEINKIYKNSNGSNKYLNSNNRLASTIAGVAAFLTRDEMWNTHRFGEEEHAEIGAEWGMAINRKLYELDVFSEYIENIENDTELDTIEEMNINIVKIHQEIKGSAKGYLIKGLDMKHNFILDSYYDKYRKNQKLVKKVNQKFQDIGWNLKV